MVLLVRQHARLKIVNVLNYEGVKPMEEYGPCAPKGREGLEERIWSPSAVISGR